MTKKVPSVVQDQTYLMKLNLNDVDNSCHGDLKHSGVTEGKRRISVKQKVCDQKWG